MSEAKTSEERHDIMAQPQDTCPMIDKVIGVIDEIEKEANIGRHDEDDVDALTAKLSSIETSINFPFRDGVRERLEEIRENASNIRAWGQEWKDLALQLLDEIDGLKAAHQKEAA